MDNFIGRACFINKIGKPATYKAFIIVAEKRSAVLSSKTENGIFEVLAEVVYNVKTFLKISLKKVLTKL